MDEKLLLIICEGVNVYVSKSDDEINKLHEVQWQNTDIAYRNDIFEWKKKNKP